MMKITPVQPTVKAKNSLRHNAKDNFQNILETKECEIDTDQVYNKTTCEIISDLDNMDHDTLKNLLREE